MNRESLNGIIAELVEFLADRGRFCVLLLDDSPEQRKFIQFDSIVAGLGSTTLQEGVDNCEVVLHAS